MEISEAIESYMRSNGYSAIIGDDCHCTLEDLFPCGDCWLDCELGYLNDCAQCAENDPCEVKERSFDEDGGRLQWA